MKTSWMFCQLDTLKKAPLSAETLVWNCYDRIKYCSFIIQVIICKKTSVVRSVPIDENGAVDYAQAAKNVIDNRIVDDTKYGYGRKVETMKRWFAEEYPEERA